MMPSNLLIKVWKLLVCTFLSAILLAAVVWIWIYYAAFRIKETPTCANFRASVPANMADKLLPSLQSIVEPAGLKSKVKSDTFVRWESNLATVSYYADRESNEYSFFICSNNHDPKLWQEISIKVEQVLQRNFALFSAWLQLNNHDFQCNPNCVVDLTLPLDFENLNRTVLVPKDP